MQGTRGTAGLTSNQRLARDLARDIAERLVREGLIDGSRRTAFELGLASGNLSAEDWLAFVELSTHRERSTR